MSCRCEKRPQHLYLCLNLHLYLYMYFLSNTNPLPLFCRCEKSSKLSLKMGPHTFLVLNQFHVLHLFVLSVNKPWHVTHDKYKSQVPNTRSSTLFLCNTKTQKMQEWGKKVTPNTHSARHINEYKYNREYKNQEKYKNEDRCFRIHTPQDTLLNTNTNTIAHTKNRKNTRMRIEGSCQYIRRETHC